MCVLRQVLSETGSAGAALLLAKAIDTVAIAALQMVQSAWRWQL